MKLSNPMKITVLGLLLVSLGFLSVANVPAAGNKVAICHFAGHDGDFVTNGSGQGCLDLGGNVMIVGRAACEKGHKASASSAGDCATADNIDLLTVK